MTESVPRSRSSFKRVGDQFLQNVPVHICQLLNIQANFAGCIFTKLLEQWVVRVVAYPDIERDVLFAGGEGDMRHIAFPPTFVLVMIGAKADNGKSPHFWLFLRHLLHDLDDLKAILALLSSSTLLKNSSTLASFTFVFISAIFDSLY